MKKLLLITLAALLLCFVPRAAEASCASDLTNYFSQYNPTPTTTLVSQSGTSITLQVHYYTSISGYSTLNGDPNCPMPYPEVFHRAWAQIIVGSGSSGKQEGLGQCATCQLSQSASFAQNMSSNDAPVVGYSEGGADCNLAGNFFSVLPSLQLEVAYTRAKGTGTYNNCTGVSVVVCDYQTFSDCDSLTSPPDMPISAVRASFPEAPPLIWECFGLGFRWYPYQLNFTFTNATIYAYKSGIDLPGHCTKNQ